MMAFFRHHEKLLMSVLIPVVTVRTFQLPILEWFLSIYNCHHLCSLPFSITANPHAPTEEGKLWRNHTSLAVQHQAGGGCSVRYKDLSYRKNHPWRLSLRQTGLNLKPVVVAFRFVSTKKPAKLIYTGQIIVKNPTVAHAAENGEKLRL